MHRMCVLIFYNASSPHWLVRIFTISLTLLARIKTIRSQTLQRLLSVQARHSAGKPSHSEFLRNMCNAEALHPEA